MKVKLMLCVLLVFSLVSCNNTDELEDRIDELEDLIGNDQPLKVDFFTETEEGDDVVEKGEYVFKNSFSGAMERNVDGSYDIWVSRAKDLGENEYGYIQFEYDPETEEIYNEYLYIEMVNQFGDVVQGDFQYWDSETELSITVKSINLETGKIEISATGVTTEDSEYNEYLDKPMQLSLSFKGNLPLYTEIAD